MLRDVLLKLGASGLGFGQKILGIGILGLLIGNPILFGQLQAEEAAIQFYDEGRYAEAATLYDSLIRLQPYNAYLLYNRGNCAFKAGQFGQAICYYLMAARLKPFNPDIQHNLRYALSLAKDEIPLPEPFFLIRWLGYIGSVMPPGRWWIMAFSLSLVAVVAMAFYTFSPNLYYRKWGFRISLSLFTLVLFFILPPLVHQSVLSQKMAIVTIPVCDVSSEPSPLAPKIFILHEGAVARIKDSTETYYHIMVDHLRQGWVEKSKVAVTW
jgi:tetratricopeptide (TPR) repeat protein